MDSILTSDWYFTYNELPWRGVRVVEGDGLENRCAGFPRTVGSNPTLSARLVVACSRVGLPKDRHFLDLSCQVGPGISANPPIEPHVPLSYYVTLMVP